MTTVTLTALPRRLIPGVALTWLFSVRAQAEGRPMKTDNHIRRLTFERSGGLVFLVLGGTVLLDGPSPAVDTEAGTRALTKAEEAMFAAVDVARARTATMPLTPAGADTYQWDVILTLTDGAEVPLRWHAHATLDPAMEAVVPGITGLAAWAQREVDRIWAHRAGAPRP